MTPTAPRALISVLLACVLSIGALAVGAGASTAATKKQPTDVGVQVVGGSAANRATTPWFLQLALDDPVGGGSLCGATAIAPRWAITAAHCVASSSGRIRIGPGRTAILVNPVLRGHGTRYYIQRALVHPRYRAASPLTFHDVALLQTYVPMPVTPLPLNEARGLPALNAVEKVFGFGLRESNNYASLPGRLQQGNVRDLAGPKNACGLYGSSYNPAYPLCSGLVQGGIDSCQGDSGGPLTATIGGRTRLVGIVSSGADCALPDYPGIYTRISTYIPWIRYYTSGQIYTQSACTPPGCALSRGQLGVIRLTNVTAQPGSYRIYGGTGVTSLNRRSGLLSGGQRNGIIVALTTAQRRCINLYVKATGSPVRRILISANGQSGCK